MPVPAVAIELYDATPADFVARRDALVAELRARGDRSTAAAVKALRRPTVAAAAINHLARTHPDVVEASMVAGEALATAQRRALSGVSGVDVRGAVRAHHDAIDAVLAAAPDATSWPVAVRDAVQRTLQAAAVDDALAEDVRRGTLSRAADTADPTLALTGFAPLSMVADGRGEPHEATPGAETAPAPDQAPDDDASAAGEEAAATDAARMAEERRRAAEAAMLRRTIVRLRATRDERISTAAGARRRATRAAEQAAAADAARQQAVDAAAEARRVLEAREAEVQRADAAVRAALDVASETDAAVGPADAALAEAEEALSVAQETLAELERKDG
ncbi:hypothetical protein [Euzebya pacifica]|uniref:hypothetical protein n=1 Tax=Euzebya pacifica TaxID=1608957 RepID=UPI0030F817F9